MVYGCFSLSVLHSIFLCDSCPTGRICDQNVTCCCILLPLFVVFRESKNKAFYTSLVAFATRSVLQCCVLYVSSSELSFGIASFVVYPIYITVLISLKRSDKLQTEEM